MQSFKYISYILLFVLVSSKPQSEFADEIYQYEYVLGYQGALESSFPELKQTNAIFKFLENSFAHFLYSDPLYPPFEFTCDTCIITDVVNDVVALEDLYRTFITDLAVIPNDDLIQTYFNYITVLIKGIIDGKDYIESDFCMQCKVKPSTASPTTEAPTTAAPTTAAPTTAVPTTAAPTTLRPTTAAPTTAVPTTSSPSYSWCSCICPIELEKNGVKISEGKNTFVIFGKYLNIVYPGFYDGSCKVFANGKIRKIGSCSYLQSKTVRWIPSRNGVTEKCAVMNGNVAFGRVLHTNGEQLLGKIVSNPFFSGLIYNDGAKEYLATEYEALVDIC